MDGPGGQVEPPAISSYVHVAIKKIKSKIFATGDPNELKLRRRKAWISAMTLRLPQIQLALFFLGYMWLLAIPYSRLGRSTYADENALQAGQVNTYWNWGEVAAADRYLQEMEVLRDSNSTGEQRAQYFKETFQKIGLPASTQSYTISTSAGIIRGENAYAVLKAPRNSGTEAIVISSSWASMDKLHGNPLNLRGVATVLALSGYLKRYSLWAKDIVFVVSDGHLDGMQAWLTQYHGVENSNIRADELYLTSGVIWTALNIDYPGHSFSHLGVFFEGVNGRLPNQDFINSFNTIAFSAGVPVVLYDHVDRPTRARASEKNFMSFLIPPSLRNHPEIKEYISHSQNIVRHAGYQARGQPSGVHGLFHRFRIDAITIFAVPSTGPHGFYSIGRIIESTLRTMNNLLERLHASFFFYILAKPDHFLKIGSYLPSAVLVSVAMIFRGLACWVNAGWIQIQNGVSSRKKIDPALSNRKRWSRRNRDALSVIAIMAMTHIAGFLLFILIKTPFFNKYMNILSPIIMIALVAAPLTALVAPPTSTDAASLSSVLKALNLCFASTVISITSVLNFSLAAFLAVLLGIPLSISTSSSTMIARLMMYSLYALLGLSWLLFCQAEMTNAIWQWEVLSVWFAPFVCIAYVPLTLQAGIVCLLPP